jgi:glycosyltransferase involved in cell wall biosynthesis
MRWNALGPATTKKIMRILILTISYHPNVGGVETHLHDWTRWLANKPDLEIDVLTYQPITTKVRGAPKENEGRVRIFRIPWFGRTLFHRFESTPILQFLYLAPRLFIGTVFHLLREGNYDVIHAQGLIAIWVAGVVKKLKNIPVLGSLHTVYVFQKESETAKQISKVLLSADKVLSCSKTGYLQMKQYGINPERIGDFTYWVDQNIFKPYPADEGKKLYNLPMDKTLCLFVGLLLQLKGLDLFFNLVKKFPHLYFVSSGDGPYEEKCRKLESEVSNYKHLGYLPNHKLAQLYSACDLLLIPSVFTEGLPRVSCEALSCGLPVIASNRGGTKEAIVPEVGILVEPSIESFAQGIENWFKQKIPGEEVKRRCRSHAEKLFGFKNAEDMELILREVKNNHHELLSH